MKVTRETLSYFIYSSKKYLDLKQIMALNVVKLEKFGYLLDGIPEDSDEGNLLFDNDKTTEQLKKYAKLNK